MDSDEPFSLGDDMPFSVRLAQTIAWCAPRASLDDLRRSLRSDELEPWILDQDRSAVVGRVLTRRGSHGHPEVRAAAPDLDLRGGRLLVYFPDENLADGAAEAETSGFFDAENVPPWDTWIGLYRDDAADISFADYLVSWVPADFVSLVDRGIDVNPEECIVWLATTRVPLADHLRSVGFLR